MNYEKNEIQIKYLPTKKDKSLMAYNNEETVLDVITKYCQTKGITMNEHIWMINGTTLSHAEECQQKISEIPANGREKNPVIQAAKLSAQTIPVAAPYIAPDDFPWTCSVQIKYLSKKGLDEGIVWNKDTIVLAAITKYCQTKGIKMDEHM